MDIRVKDGHRWTANRYQTKAGTTALEVGDLVKQGTSGDVEYVFKGANGDTNSAAWVGVVVSADTVTAGADGEVYVVDAADALFTAKATTYSNITPASILTKVTLDVTNGVQTLDENDTTNGAFLILEADDEREEVTFKIDRSTKVDA